MNFNKVVLSQHKRRASGTPTLALRRAEPRRDKALAEFRG